jgi:hypothetical protein
MPSSNPPHGAQRTVLTPLEIYRGVMPRPWTRWQQATLLYAIRIRGPHFAMIAAVCALHTAV